MGCNYGIRWYCNVTKEYANSSLKSRRHIARDTETGTCISVGPGLYSMCRRGHLQPLDVIFSPVLERYWGVLPWAT